MEYKFKPIEFNIEKVEDIELPTARDRVIEKRGDVVEFSMNDIDNHINILTKARKEHAGMVEHENAIVDNIEHFHKFVKKLTDEELLTAWMYKESKEKSKIHGNKIKEIDEQLAEYDKEKAEIIKQIPELDDIKSADIIDEEVVLVETNKE
jgi:hypothetical protein